jgi:hypothetical protein
MKGSSESPEEENINVINKVSSLKLLPAPPINATVHTNNNNSSNENNSL